MGLAVIRPSGTDAVALLRVRGPEALAAGGAVRVGVARKVRGVATPRLADVAAVRTSLPLAFMACAAVGVLGGMIGLGGAEFRLPLLITLFGFAALQAVIVNKALSLVVVVTALPARLVAVPWSTLAPHWTVAVNLLAGSLVGAFVGASWATRMRSATLYRVLAVLLVLIAAVLIGSHVGTLEPVSLGGAATVAVGVVAGFFIGVVAAIMGVAGGELLIPTIVLLFGLDIKLAGSLSLAVSLPTMLVAFARYSRDAELRRAPPARPAGDRDGAGLDRRHSRRRPAPRRGPRRGARAGADAAVGAVGGQDVAARAGMTAQLGSAGPGVCRSSAGAGLSRAARGLARRAAGALAEAARRAERPVRAALKT